MPAIGWYNGICGNLSEMTIPMNDRAVYFGDGCYEACLAVGTRAFALSRHLDRFEHSLKGLSIPFCPDRDAFIRTLTDCLAAANETCSVLYWQVSRATAQRTHAFPTGETAPNLLITVTPKKLAVPEQTMKLVTTEDIRYAMCDVKTLNLIPNVLANERAKECGADEAVFVRNGFVTEGSHTNVHILKDGVLCTHPTDRYILPGVTRAILLGLCKGCSIPVSEQAFAKEALFSADEVVITSSTLGVRRAETIDGIAVGGRDEARYQRILQAYERRFSEEMRV